ncbi:MAG TPA: SDR family oxidoreductase [Candidatus Binataceae bacterium]|nr:SDR family oxidoreductase [Candidatus Binataceae bacterium]
MATALVTGASAGIGEEFAYALARERYELVLVARREARLAEVAEKARVFGSGKVLTIAADLSRRETPAAILRQLTEQNVAIEYLVNNAGFGTHGRFSELPLEREFEEIDLNVGALVALTRLFVPAMVARRHGTIINVASTAAFQALPYMATYAATKAYVVSFSLAMAAELRGTGVTIMALCPGPTHSEFHAVAGIAQVRMPEFMFMDAKTVAAQGIAAARRGKALHINGKLNRALAESNRVSPRTFVTRMVARFYRPGGG